MRILIADDDPIARMIVQTTLRSLGHDAQAVADGDQAWNSFQSLRPDVVISDWMMPGRNGLELCASIRNHAVDDYTYFILVTAQGAPDQILQGMNAGADDYLVKPLSREDLRARLVGAVRVTSLHRQLGVRHTELQDLNAELTAIARRDTLTGLGNRRALQEDLDVLEARVARYGHRYCMAVLDVDHFKAYNDNQGHQAGDRVLQTLSRSLLDAARSGDAIYRYGGEEFLCVFPEQSLATGARAVERMRLGIERLAISHPDSPFGVVTISAGLAVLEARERRSAHDVLKEADDALYRAKALGRNRCEVGARHPLASTQS